MYVFFHLAFRRGSSDLRLTLVPPSAWVAPRMLFDFAPHSLDLARAICIHKQIARCRRSPVVTNRIGMSDPFLLFRGLWWVTTMVRGYQCGRPWTIALGHALTASAG
jgi:hypothetical protein